MRCPAASTLRDRLRALRRLAPAMASTLALGACAAPVASPSRPAPSVATPFAPMGGDGVTGFGASGAPGARGSRAPRPATLGASGRVGARDVRIASAFLLTPDVEGPVELHAFEADVAQEAICPAGLSVDPAGVVLRVVLPDTRRNDDPALVTWVADGDAVATRAASVEVSRGGRGGAALVEIDLRGDGDDRLRGIVTALVCPDDREAP